MTRSKKYKLGKRDFFNGLLLAVGAPVLVILQQSVSAGSLAIDWNTLKVTAIASGLAYLSKNIFQGEK